MSKQKVLERFEREHDALVTLAREFPNPCFGGYVFTVEVWNGTSIYELEKVPHGSIRLSLTEDVPEDDEAWEMAAKCFGIE